MTEQQISKRAHDLIVELLEAQISNVDPLDTKRIMNRWHFVICEAIRNAAQDVSGERMAKEPPPPDDMGGITIQGWRWPWPWQAPVVRPK
jgi:hypothetical protein